MKTLKNKNFYKFLIPSLIGILLFITPIKDGTNFTIPIALIANSLLDLIKNYTTDIIFSLIMISTIITCLNKLFKFESFKQNKTLNSLFNPTPFWFITRLVGALIIILFYFNLGPSFIISADTSGLIINDLMPILLCVFLLAGMLLPLLLNYGLMDFFGVLLIKVMRPVFNLPGRSAIDCIASWLGDGSIGVLLTAKQYEQGFYSKREACVIATTFSAVSITFALVVLSEVGLEAYFIPFYLTVALAGIVAAIIVPKLAPLSKIPDTYLGNHDTIDESIPNDTTAIKYALDKAIDSATHSLSFKQFIIEGLKNVMDMYFQVLPVILAFGTITLIIATYTPVFKILGLPFIPIYYLLGIPEAQLASQTVIVGFADMFLPSIMAHEITSDLTRFVIATTSVVQLIYMSEIGSIILGSSIDISIKDLFIIFIQRTLVTLPIIAIVGHILF